MRSTTSRSRHFVVLAFLFALALPLLMPSMAWAVTGNGADINGDGVVNLADVGLFVQLFLSGVYQPAADVDCNGTLDLADVAAFVAAL